MIVLFKGTKPTYGELIDIFERLDGQPNAPDMLSAEITKRYPGLEEKHWRRSFLKKEINSHSYIFLR